MCYFRMYWISTAMKIFFYIQESSWFLYNLFSYLSISVSIFLDIFIYFSIIWFFYIFISLLFLYRCIFPKSTFIGLRIFWKLRYIVVISREAISKVVITYSTIKRDSNLIRLIKWFYWCMCVYVCVYAPCVRTLGYMWHNFFWTRNLFYLGYFIAPLFFSPFNAPFDTFGRISRDRASIILKFIGKYDRNCAFFRSRIIKWMQQKSWNQI